MYPRALFVALRLDPRALMRTYAKETVALALLVAGTLALSGAARLTLVPSLGLAEGSMLFTAAIPFGWWIAAVVHNAGHGNYRSPVVNRLMGELAGLYLGYGFASFVLIHSLHHAHADRLHDPVSPRGMGFARFLSGPMRHAMRRARAYLDSVHGQADGYGRVRRIEALLFHLNLVLRVAFWYAALGPSGFVWFYLPSIASEIAILAHINYACHRDRPDGAVEVVDLDHTLYYRLANAVTSGGYFHRSHHLHPSLFDPRRAATAGAVLVTVPPAERPRSPRPTRRAGWLARYFDLDGIWGPDGT